MQITFSCKSGSLSGQKFTFSDPVVTFGRDQSSMIRFDAVKEPRVSAAHCEVFCQDDKFYVRDKGSMNGTLVNGAPITSPTLLRNGSLLKLGDKGPEFEIYVLRDDDLNGTLANTVPSSKAQAQLSPALQPSNGIASPAKQGIGLLTLEGKLSEAKQEVRSEYTRKSRTAILATVVVLVVALAVTGIVYWKHSGEIQTIQTQIERYSKDLQAVVAKTDAIALSVAANKEEWQDNIKFVTDNIRKSQTSIAELKKNLETQTAVSAVVRDEWKQKLDAQNKALNDMQNDLRNYQQKNESMLQTASAPFAGYGERFGNAIYSVVIKFEENGNPQIKFVASAFAICPDPGLLATNAHVVKKIESLIKRSDYEVQVRCSASPRYIYRVTKALGHPSYDLRNNSIASADVGILQVDLQTEGGERLALPGYLYGATDEELDVVQSGMIMAIFGFPGSEAELNQRVDGATNRATLVPGIVSSIQSFSGMPVTGRVFEFLQHTCYAIPGNSGSPLLNANGKVVALQNGGMLVKMADGAFIPAAPVTYAVNVRFLRELLKRHYPQVVWN